MDDDKIIGNNGNDTPLNEEAKNEDGNAANTDDYTDVVANAKMDDENDMDELQNDYVSSNRSMLLPLSTYLECIKNWFLDYASYVNLGTRRASYRRWIETSSASHTSLNEANGRWTIQ